MTIPLVAAMLICAVWTATSAVLVSRFLEQRGHSISFFRFRAMILTYLEQYRRITREETGRVGPLFYHYVVPLYVAAALAIILLAITLFGNAG